jgi:hypothetical protein
MNTGVKGAILVIGAYVVTVGLTACIITFAIMSLLDESSCSVMTKAMVALWVTIAVLFIVSIIVVRVMAWKINPSVAGRWAILVAHALALVLTYFVIAFGLLVAFNC